MIIIEHDHTIRISEVKVHWKQMDVYYISLFTHYRYGTKMFAFRTRDVEKLQKYWNLKREDREYKLFQMVESKFIAKLHDWIEIINESVRDQEEDETMPNIFNTSFQKWEFDSKHTKAMSRETYNNLKELADNLHVLRKTIDSAIIINSGYRTNAENKAVGGSPGSKHLIGQAADFHCIDHTPEELHKIVEDLIKMGKMKEGGLGKYATHLHYDIRGTKARW